MTDRPKVIRETDAEAVRLGKTLVRNARFGALAVLDPNGGGPLASRVGVATDFDGSPLILVSMLSAHTRALIADPRCSLLLGEPGNGDPLAHPRISLICTAEQLDRHSDLGLQASRRYLSRHPKAELYANLGDFHFFRLGIQRANLNGGFGRAYLLEANDLASPTLPGLAAMEQGAIKHMNEDHADAVALYARVLAREDGEGWRIIGFDAEGLDLATGDRTSRVWFKTTLQMASELRQTLAAMARSARENRW